MPIFDMIFCTLAVAPSMKFWQPSSVLSPSSWPRLESSSMVSNAM
jgi:hypothetical protein